MPGPSQAKLAALVAEIFRSPTKDEADDPLACVDLATSASALTDADDAALDSLGTSAELAARVVALAKQAAAAEKQADPREARSTLRQAGVPTCNMPKSLPAPNAPSLSYAEVWERLRASELEPEVSWSSSYRKIRELGRGGQGIVYLAKSLNEDNLSKALKVFSPEPYGDADAYYGDMARMAHMASVVNGIPHDNLVIVERFAYHNCIPMMVMRWIEGHDLRYLLQPKLYERLRCNVDEQRWLHLNKVVGSTKDTPLLRLMPGMAVNIVEKCLRALAALHRMGVVHGDIKLSNIMLDHFGSIRLVDFGSAFEIDSPPQQHAWTPQYAAPETLERGERTPLSDLASLGYVLIELLSGVPIVPRTERGPLSMRTLDPQRDKELLAAKKELPDRLVELIPENVRASKRLMTICRLLIDPDPARRFRGAQDALEGPNGTYQFLQELAKGDLAVYYANEIERWLTDVLQVDQRAEAAP